MEIDCKYVGLSRLHREMAKLTQSHENSTYVRRGNATTIKMNQFYGYLCVGIFFSSIAIMYQKTQVPEDTLDRIFEEVGEQRAVECLHEWRNRV